MTGAGWGHSGSPGSDGTSPYLSLHLSACGTGFLGERPHADPPLADPPTRFSLGLTVQGGARPGSHRFGRRLTLPVSSPTPIAHADPPTRFSLGGDAVQGGAKPEAPVRTEPHPTGAVISMTRCARHVATRKCGALVRAA